MSNPTQQQLDDFLKRAKFSYGWDKLESSARRMVEHACGEVEALQARVKELEKANEVLTILNKCKPLPLDVADIEAERDSALAKLAAQPAKPVEPKPRVLVGTIGHIDSGKTTLTAAIASVLATAAKERT